MRFKLRRVAENSIFTYTWRDQHHHYSILISPGSDHCSRQEAHELQAVVISCLHPMGATVIRCFCFCDLELVCIYMQLLQRLPGQAEVSAGLCYHVTLQIACIKSNFIDHDSFGSLCITGSKLDDVA